MNTRLFIAAGMFALVLSACLAMPRAASAQAFSFSIGHGHHHHHGHRHHYGWHYDHHWHDPYWWGPHYDYIYVAPPPVVRREIQYVEPIEQRVIETRVVPPRVTSPTRSPASQPIASASRPAAQTPLQIWNSAGQKLSVGFVVDGQEVTLADGQSHTFYGGGAKLVEFDRGGDYGTARRSLTGSQYEFVITDAGWDLVRRGEGGPLAPRADIAAPRNELPTRR